MTQPPGRRSREQPPLFDDDKAPDAFRTIGEVSEALAIRPHVLRYWEEQFEMLRPVKRSGGRRYYRPEDIALLRRIDDLLNRQGYTIRGARLALRAATAKGAQEPEPRSELRPEPQPEPEADIPAPVEMPTPVASPARDSAAGNAQIIRKLRAIRERLSAALDAA